MKKNRVIALILCLVMMALTLSACGQKDAAAQPGLDLEGKTADELFEMENNILGENTALWDKVFMSMSKNVTSDILNGNYGEFLISAVESAKDQFTAEEYALLKADAEKVRDIENKMSELDNAGEGGTEDSSASANAFPEFQGKDLDGNSVDNSLFANNAFTVVNFWFNGCKPCVGELDDLNALNERVKEQGGEVIGINTETLDGNEQGIATAKQLLESTGAKYRNIYFDSNSAAGNFALSIMAFPTTYVFDRSGNVVGEPLLGGIDNEQNLEMLQKTIDEAIARDKA